MMAANFTAEIETDDVTEDELDDLELDYQTCNGFAFGYIDDHDAEVRVGTIKGDPQLHCWVYDHDRDVTIDATLGQFDGHADAGAWDGDDHPHATDEDPEVWEDAAEFREEYEYVYGPFDWREM